MDETTCSWIGTYEELKSFIENDIKLSGTWRAPEDFLKPVIRKEPNSIILHVGTNDVEHHTAKRVAEGVLNLATQVTQDSPSTEVVISAILPRTDKPNLMAKVKEANRIMYSFCVANNWSFIDYNSINPTYLKTRGLHLNRKGTSQCCRTAIFRGGALFSD